MTKIMKLPKIGVNMTEATIVAWKAAEGESVAEGQPLFEAETDKAVQEFESKVTGVLEKILAPPGTTVACQEPVASFRVSQQGVAVESAVHSAGGRQQDSRSPLAITLQGVAPSPPEQESRPGIKRLRISPLARRMARALGVEVSSIRPVKPGARIAKKDILAQYARTGADADMGGASIPRSGIRKTIASRMSQSVREAASAALTIRVNAARLLNWREELKARSASVNLSVLVAVLVGKALERFPILNATLTDEAIKLHKEINIGMAVDSERGLVVPVLRRINSRTVVELLEEFRRLVAAIRKGSITAEDLANGTFTITNLGGLGIESFTPIINPPQCAILALGAITREAVPAESGNQIEVRQVMRLTLVFDHRMVDGAPAARFLQCLKELVESGIEER